MAISLSLILFFFSLGINLFSSHTGDFVEIANTSILVIVLVFASIMELRLYRNGSNRKEANQVWLLFGLGLGIYALAEIVWLAYLFAGGEPPYPGPPDLIYFVAYILLIIALFNKNRLLGIRPPKKRIAVLCVICGIVLVLTSIFVIYPISYNASAGTLLETAVSLFYPLADLVFLCLALLLIFALWGGKISSSWFLIGLSGIVLALADIVFVYADWNGLYYPGNQINVISELADMGYIVFALLSAMGVFMQGRLVNITEEEVKSFLGTPRVQQQTFHAQEMISMPKAEGVIFSDRSDRLIYINDYMRQLVIKFGGTPPTLGQPIREILGLDESTFRIFKEEVIRNAAMTRHFELNFKNRQIPFSLLVSARKNQKREFDGTDMFLTLIEEGLNTQVQEELKLAETGNHLLKDVWSKLSNIGQLDQREQKILAYLIAKFTALYIFIARMAGLTAAQRVSDVFNKSARDAGIAITVKDGNALFESPPETNKLRLILKEVFLYSQNLVSKDSLLTFQNFFDQTIPNEILEAVKADTTNS